MKLFTLLELDEIEQIMKQHPKEIQHRLAFEVTKFIHGEEAAEQAQKVPTIEFARPGLLTEVLVRSKLAPSKSAARRLIEQGGVKLNDQRVTDPETKITKKDFGSQGVAALQVGKRRKVVIRYAG